MSKKWYLRICRRTRCNYAAFDSLSDIINITVSNPSYLRHVIEKQGYWYSSRYLITRNRDDLTGAFSLSYGLYGQTFSNFITENSLNYKNVITGETLINPSTEDLPAELLDGKMNFIARLSNKCTDIPYGEWMTYINDDLRDLLPGELELIKLYSERKKVNGKLKYPRIGYVDSDGGAYLNLCDVKQNHPDPNTALRDGSVRRIYPNANDVITDYTTFMKLEDKE